MLDSTWTPDVHSPDATMLSGPVSQERWPKIAATVLSCAVIVVLGILLLPHAGLTSSSTAEDQQRYALAQENLTAAHDALTLTVGHAVTILKRADQLPPESLSQVRGDVDRLRAFLNEEPPAHEPPAVEGLSHEEFDIILQEMEDTRNMISELAHKVARQARKLEVQLDDLS